MTTFMDLMSLAKRVLAGGDAELGGQISVLALDSQEMQPPEEPEGPQAEADQEALDNQSLLDVLENGAEDQGLAGIGQNGETPIATVLDILAVTKALQGAGHTREARALNDILCTLSPIHIGVEPPTVARYTVRPEIRHRWAELCAALWNGGRKEVAADVVGTLMLRASEVKQFDLMAGDVPVLEELHEMLDELGYESIMEMGEKRRKELERGPPGIHVPYQQSSM